MSTNQKTIQLTLKLNTAQDNFEVAQLIEKVIMDSVLGGDMFRAEVLEIKTIKEETVEV